MPGGRRIVAVPASVEDSESDILWILGWSKICDEILSLAFIPE